MMDLFGKMGEMQQKMAEIQQRLDKVTVIGEAEGGAVKVTMNANRKVVNIEIAQALISEGDKEHIEDLLTTAINRAGEQAASVAETETAAIYKDMLPGLQGLGM